MPVSPSTTEPPLPSLAVLACSAKAVRRRREGWNGAAARKGPMKLPPAGAEPGLTEESPAFAATVEEPLEGGHTPCGLGRAAEKDVRPGGVGVLEVWRQAEGCWSP